MKAILMVSHGSRWPQAKKEVVDLVDRLRRRRVGDIVECAFLELEIPNISEGIDLCVAQKAQEVVVLLNFLNSGRHVDRDIPAIVRESQLKHPTVKISITQPVGQHPHIEDLFLDLLKE